MTDHLRAALTDLLKRGNARSGLSPLDCRIALEMVEALAAPPAEVREKASGASRAFVRKLVDDPNSASGQSLRDVEVASPSDTTPAQERRGEIAEGNTCPKCQGNGEIVTDWDTYLHPKDLSAEEGSVTECPDCDGEGTCPIAEPSISRRAAEFISEHDLYDESGLSKDELELLRQTPVALPPSEGEPTESGV